jgi:hypothetical protein
VEQKGRLEYEREAHQGGDEAVSAGFGDGIAAAAKKNDAAQTKNDQFRDGPACGNNSTGCTTHRFSPAVGPLSVCDLN